MNRIIKWLNEHRRDDSSFIQFLRFGYSIGKKSWFHAIISAVLGIITPIFFDYKHYVIFVFLLLFLIFDIFYATICHCYSNYYNSRRNYAFEQTNPSNILNSIKIQIENSDNWYENIFEEVSKLVCQKIYDDFKDFFRCETRVAIEYTYFDKDNVQCIKMAGRASKKRSIARAGVPIEDRKQYYSYKIFKNNNVGINILDGNDLYDEKIWYTNSGRSIEINRYIGIAVDINRDKKVRYILEIDFINEFDFGDDNTKNAIKTFIDQYLTTYINIVSIFYLLNQKTVTPEV